MPRSCPGVGRRVGVWFQNLQVDLFSHIYISWQCSIHVMCMNCKYMLWLYKYPLLKGRVGKDLNKMVCPTPWIQSRPNCNTLTFISPRNVLQFKHFNSVLFFFTFRFRFSFCFCSFILCFLSCFLSHQDFLYLFRLLMIFST